MLRWIEPGDEDFTAFCVRDAFGTRISALYTLYGGASFARFYAQNNAKGYTAALGGVDGDLTLCAAREADFAELAAFVHTCGFETLLCEESVRAKVGLPHQHSGPVFCFQKAQAQKNGTVQPQLLERDSLREAYTLLQESGFSDLPVLGDWLADMTARQKAGASAVWGIRSGGRLQATASLLFQTQQAAFLGALATAAESRGEGYGGALLSFLAHKSAKEGRRTELFCRDGGIERFYRKQGFLPCGRWTQ